MGDSQKSKQDAPGAIPGCPESRNVAERGLARNIKDAYNRRMAKRVITPKRSKPPKKSVIKEDAAPPQEFLPPSPISGHALPASTLWPKGISQNPGGAPKGKRITTWLAEFGEMTRAEWPTAEQLQKMPANASIAIAQLLRAQDPTDGLPAAAWAADRVEGGVDRTVHLTHKQEPTMSLEDASEMVRQAKLDGPGAGAEEF